MNASSLVCLLALAAMVSTAPQSSIPISNNSKSKPVEEIKPIAPTVPVPAESKPREWLSSTATIADRSRCLKDYRSQKPDAPLPSAAEIASPHQYPFVVSIVYYSEISVKGKGYHLECSGSLISPTKILTVAGCLYLNPTYEIFYPVENLTVRLGMQFVNETTSDAQVTRNVKKIDKLDFFTGLTIVTTDSPVEYTDTISPVCLVPDCFDDDSGQSVIAMGWEYSSHPHEIQTTKNSASLGFVRLSTLPMSKCYSDEDNKDFYQNGKLCAQNKCGDFCTNYPGGPVVIENNSRDDTTCRFMQVGVFGSYYDFTTVGTFLRVKKHLTWIEENTK